MSRKRTKRRSSFDRVNMESGGESLKISAWIGAALILMFAAGLSFVWLQDTTQELVQDVQTEQQKLQVLKKQTNNLRMELAHLKSGSYIAQQVQRFDLDLRQAAPGQVRRVPITAPPQEDSGETTDLVAAIMREQRNPSR